MSWTMRANNDARLVRIFAPRRVGFVLGFHRFLICLLQPAYFLKATTTIPWIVKHIRWRGLRANWADSKSLSSKDYGAEPILQDLLG